MYTSAIIVLKFLLSLYTHVSVGALLMIKQLSYPILSYHPWASLSVDALKANNDLQDP